MSTNGTDGIGNRVGFDFDVIFNDNAGETVGDSYYYVNLAGGLKIGNEVKSNNKSVLQCCIHICMPSCIYIFSLSLFLFLLIPIFFF